MTSLKIATKDDKELYKNLFNMLQNDLSPYCNDEPLELNKDGYFDSTTVDVYFTGDENIIPYVIYNDNKIAGAVVLTRAPYVKDGCEYCIQELFVLGLYRGKNVAAKACEKIFSKYKGRYCVIALKENIRAIKFWNKLIEKNSILLNSESLDEQSIVYEFEIR